VAFPEVEYPNWPQCERLFAHAQLAAQRIREYRLRVRVPPRPLTSHLRDSLT
jgi:hypothetical protein